MTLHEHRGCTTMIVRSLSRIGLSGKKNSDVVQAVSFITSNLQKSNNKQMSDLAAIRSVVDAELRDAHEQGLTISIPPDHIGTLLLILELSHLLTEEEIGDPEEWRARVKKARQEAFEKMWGNL